MILLLSSSLECSKTSNTIEILTDNSTYNIMYENDIVENGVLH